LFRHEAALRRQTLIEYLQHVGVLTHDDRAQQNDLELYEASGHENLPELARIMERSPYVRELVRMYRPQLYERAVQAE
jgi:hypothetical protein